MAGKGDGEGEGNTLKLEGQITLIKYVILFTNVLTFIIGASVFALCLWLRFENGVELWLTRLDATQLFTGLYVLVAASLLIMVVSFVGCLSALQEGATALLIYIGTQVLGFIFGLSGSAVLLDNSTRDSQLQPRIRESMRRLIMNSHHRESLSTLAMIQENIGCCGADGAHDYLSLQQPLPTECRNSVTGNPYFHGCVHELTWFFEEKCAWIAALVMTLCFIHVINVVLTVVLMQALRKEEELEDSYRK